VTSQNNDAEQHWAMRNNAHKHSSATQTATHGRASQRSPATAMLVAQQSHKASDWRSRAWPLAAVAGLPEAQAKRCGLSHHGPDSRSAAWGP